MGETNKCLEAIVHGIGRCDCYFAKDQVNTLGWYRSLIRGCLGDDHPEMLFEIAKEDLDREVLDI